MTATDGHRPTYGQLDDAYFKRLVTTSPEDDGPIWMVNLMKYRDVAAYADGTTNVSGREADDRYAPIEILAEIGAEIVFVGDVDAQLLGDAPTWDRVAVVRYPTRRAFIEMQARDDFKVKHVHKAAGMEQTIVMACQPTAVPMHAGPLPAWSTVPHPPTDDDGPIVIVHVIRYSGGGSRDEIVQYQERAAEIAVPHGARIGGWFDVEGTVVGDGRPWDQVRFNRFPSKAGFMAVVTDPARVEAQRAHREPAMADTYTLVLRPIVDRLDGAP